MDNLVKPDQHVPDDAPSLKLDNMIHPNIPPQLKGDFHDTVSMLCTDSIEKAIKYFEQLEARLKSVNEWHTYSDKVKAKFSIYDPIKKQPTNSLEKGNMIKIDVPGIGNPSGSGYDWTKIIDIQIGQATKEYPFFLLTIRPCPMPDNSDETVAHFYSEDSTNTFIVRRVSTCIYAEVHGRNEIENTLEVPILDTVRNKAIAVGGKIGVGSLNWLGFTKALLEPFEP